MADGGAIVPADPCVDAENGDFTLTNGVMMNAGVGDPRWNPAGGSTPSSEITVSDADALLTAISAGKKSITLEDGAYDLSAAAVVLNSPLTLQGGKGAVVKGKFELAPGATAFTVKGITLDGAGELDNAFYVQDGASVISATLSDVAISGYKNRLFYQDKETSTVGSLVISNAVVWWRTTPSSTSAPSTARITTVSSTCAARRSPRRAPSRCATTSSPACTVPLRNRPTPRASRSS